MRNTRSRKSRPPRRWITLVLAVAVAVGVGGAYWWSAQTAEPAGGTPRLAVDRDVIDFGDVSFETPVNAVFTLRNTGDGVLRLVGTPRVQVLAGC